MKNYVNKLIEFETIFNKFKKPDHNNLIILDQNATGLRYNLMSEENDEYLKAALQGDEVGVADALGDMLYILTGTIVKHNMGHLIEDVFNEIHRSNMSKLGDDNKPIYRNDGKVMKGPNYSPPELKHLIGV